ncbi:probable protein phosphatase 2C 8 [Argentina anserina]|uniref:probable protein phosphatase 2C 8 n=1 Tax=Argentina anserina TaxID=57926 RepID=UPI00217658E9|nr:probable protein phosphatase 2C 8 [Potentilla anserina]
MESLNPQDVDPPCFDECFKNKRQRSMEPNAAISKSCEAGDSSSGQWSEETNITTDIRMSQEEEDKGMSSGYPCELYGSISVIGRRRVMKDAVAVTKLDGYHFFAVYDGHGGSCVSNACRDRLHQLLAQEASWIRGLNGAGEVDWEKIMTTCFTKMDNEVGAAASEAKGSVNTVGTSAVVAIVGKEEIVVANSGNSRAVLCLDGVAVPLSRDHNPDRPDEKERVEAAGGRVIDWKGSRVLGVLSTSRSIGDHYLKPYVISEPEVTVNKRNGLCDFLVIASDGLWDVVSNEFACQVVRRCLDTQTRRRCSEGVSGGPAANAAALLAQLALARGSKDNITVIVVELSKSRRA